MEIKKKKVNKSVSLNPDVYDRLLVVCERLGVNVNAYLVNAVGQQIQRDEAQQVAQESMIKSLTDSFETLMKDALHEEMAKELENNIKQNNLIIPKSKK